jgi:Tfp pilus assembly protein PilN
MKVRLNLATSPLVSNRPFIVGGMGVGVLALLALFLLSWRAYGIWNGQREFQVRQVALQNQISSLQQQRMALQNFFDQPENAQRRQRAAYLNGLIQQRAFPWIKIFMDLEKTLPEGVRVVSVEPKLAGDNVQLKFVVGAATDEGKLKFLHQLETSPEFSDIRVLTESRPVRPGDTDRVMLELQAQYSAI